MRCAGLQCCLISGTLLMSVPVMTGCADRAVSSEGAGESTSGNGSGTPSSSPSPSPAASADGLAKTSVVKTDVAPGDWPWWGGPDRTLISPETGLPEQWPNSGVTVRWTREIGIGFSSIAIAGDKALTMGHRDGEEIVWCLNTQTGDEVWTHRYRDNCWTISTKVAPVQLPRSTAIEFTLLAKRDSYSVCR